MRNISQDKLVFTDPKPHNMGLKIHLPGTVLAQQPAKYIAITYSSYVCWRILATHIHRLAQQRDVIEVLQ